MATIAIAHSAATISELITSVVELRGDTAIAYGALGAAVRTYDAVIVDPAWEPGIAFAQRQRQLDSSLPVICVSSQSPTPESLALAPVAFLRMPFRVAELEAALAAALGPRSGA